MMESNIIPLLALLAAATAAGVAFIAFWMKRGQAEGTGDRAEKKVETLTAQFNALQAIVNMHHDEMLREYLRRAEFREHFTDFEDRFTASIKDIGERLGREIRSVGERMDGYLGIKRQPPSNN